MTHGSVIDDLLCSTLIPIPKRSNMNVTDSYNYRGIALSSVLGRILDLIVLQRFTATVSSHTICNLALKEIGQWPCAL
jgi:hypothetical protein